MRPLLRSSLCVLVLSCILFSNSFCGIALAESSTEQVYKLNNTRSIPQNHVLNFSSILFDKENSSLTSYSFGSITDGMSRTNQYKLDGINLANYQIGFKLFYDHQDYSGVASILNSQRNLFIDLSCYSNYLLSNNVLLTLSPYAIPSQAYVTYNGTYTFKIYDGSTGYERNIYDVSFTLSKPCDISLSNFGQVEKLGLTSNSLVGCDLSACISPLSIDDLLNDDEIYEYMASYNSYVSNDENLSNSALIEDAVISIENHSVDTIEIVCLFDCNSSNLVYYNNPYNDEPDVSGFDEFQFFTRIFESPFHDNTVNVDIYNNNVNDDITDNNGFFSVLANGFTSLMRSTITNGSQIITNATDNANRIIQNTTQKVDEVKQGVIEVKDSVVETKNSILDLPNKIKEMLIGLIVPPEEDINNKFADFETLLSDRFGLIYQSADIIHDFADSFNTSAVSVVSNGSNANTVNFPQVTVSLAGSEFVFGGYDVQLIPEGFEFLQSAVKTAISLVCTILFINMCKNKLEAILK